MNTIQDKIDSNTLSSSDQPYLNLVDQFITKGMLFLEYKIKFSKFTHPWSPTLAVAIVSVSIFKVHLSSVKNKVCKTTLIDRLHKQILSYDIPHPPSKLETNYKKNIINKLKQTSKNFALIKKLQ